MTRQIKFRVWNDENKTMSEFTLMDLCYSRPELIFEREPMQFTGLLDKNGKEIYEGDIVKWHNEYVQEIKWENIGWSGVPSTSLGDNSSCEVIGNIYQNPELLN